MKTITCFSYKGGAGRTVASANIAAALASKQARAAIVRPLDFKVALIDLDVFSAGTHRVFEIPNDGLKSLRSTVQDYLLQLQEISAADYVAGGAIRRADPLMANFIGRGGSSCRDDFTLFAAAPDPDRRFVVQKFHENHLLGLRFELEQQGFNYLVIDGESATRGQRFKITPQDFDLG